MAQSLRRKGPPSRAKVTQGLIRAAQQEQIRDAGLLTLQQAARRSGISLARLYWLARKDRLASERFGSQYGVRLADVLALRPAPPGCLTLRQAAELLGIPKQTIMLAVGRGELPLRKHLGHVVVTKAEVRACFTPPEGYVSVAEAARRTGRHVATLNEAADRGRLHPIVFRTWRMFQFKEVMAYANPWPKRHITVPEAAERAKVSKWILDRAITKGAIPAQLIGSKYAVRWRDVHAYLDRWPEGMLSIPDAAEKASVSRDVLYAGIRSGKLPTERVGLYHAVRWQDVRSLIRARSV